MALMNAWKFSLATPAQRRRLRRIGYGLLLLGAACFFVAYQSDEANAREVQNRAIMLEGLPGVQGETERPLTSKCALGLGVLTGTLGLGCVLFGIRPDECKQASSGR